MKDKFSESPFSVPYEVAVVRPLRRTTMGEREEALKNAHYNTELIPQEMIYVDLKTDSSVGSITTLQMGDLIGVESLEGGLEMAPEVNPAFVSLSQRFQEVFGFPFVVPCAVGRAAERIWAKLHVKPGSVVPGNLLFPSTRFHIESNGGKVAGVIVESAFDPFSDEPFKGNVDLEKLGLAVKEHGREKIPCVYVELCVNSCGGHPVSLENLKAVRALLQPHGIPLFLDASRILENSYLIQRREKGLEGCSIAEIVRESCAQADGLTMSALKDFSVREGGFIGIRDEKSYQKAYVQSFLDGAQPSGAALSSLAFALREFFRSDRYAADRVGQVEYLWRAFADSAKRGGQGVPVLRPAGGHGVFVDVRAFLPDLPAERHPAEALAAYIYRISGVRVTKGPPLTQEQAVRGIELLRLAVPARRYLQGHMDDVAKAFHYAFSHRDEIKGLRRIEQPGRAKYAPSFFALAEPRKL